MISVVREYIRRKFFQGQARSIKAKQNIVVLFILRGITVAVNFVLVPMTLAYLNSTKYGIWLTLSSIVSWVSFLDIGLGHGLRNKFAEALAINNTSLARTYVSTTYALIAAISLALIVLFLVVNPFLRWTVILNTSGEMERELAFLATAVFIFFCLRLVFALIGTVLMADQRPALNSALEVVASLLTLLAVYILTRNSFGSLFWLGFLVSAIGALVPLIANFLLFNSRYKQFVPSMRWVDLAYAKELLHLGARFFGLQIAGVAVFVSSNLVITQLFGPSEVTPFNIAFKYYGVASMGFSILLTPFWSAYTDAFIRGDKEWILMTMRKLKGAWIALCLLLVAMTLVANRAYVLWVGETVHIPFRLSVVMAVYVMIGAWCNIYAFFINGTGKLQLQLLVGLSIAVLVIPLSILMAKEFGLGIASVTIASCLVLLPGCFLWPIQAKKLVMGQATGIWAR